MKLRAGLTFLPLDDELVVFSEEAQCLIGLNASAALVCRELKKGTPASELAQTLAARGLAAPEEAANWVASTLDALAKNGLLADGPFPSALPAGTLEEAQQRDLLRIEGIPPYAPFTPWAERHYRLLETSALIRYSHRGQLRLVDAVIGHLATEHPRTPDVVIDIRGVKLDDGHLRSDIYRDGLPVVYAPRLSMVGPVIKGVLWQSAVNAHDFLFYIHAGVVGTGEGCILLPAPAGSGKSSLTAALTRRGFQYFSDEVALIQQKTLKVPPMPLAICVKSTGWDLMARYFPQVATLPMHWREDGKRVRYIPPPANAGRRPSRVSHLVFPRYEAGSPTLLRPIPRSEALGRLMGECLALRQRLDQENAADLVRWMGGIACYALTSSSLDEAADAVAAVAKT